jgi:hypothetical protein
MALTVNRAAIGAFDAENACETTVGPTGDNRLDSPAGPHVHRLRSSDRAHYGP